MTPGRGCMRQPLKNKPAADESPQLRWRGVVTAVAFLALLFAYVRWRIEPAAGWQRHGPQFFLTGEFFQESVPKAGGLLEYSARGLAQLDHSNLAGALAFTALAGLVFFVTWLGLRRMRGGVIWPLAFLPPLLLLAVRQVPGGQALAVGLGYVLGLGMALVLARMPGTRPWLRLTLCVVFSALLSGIAGLWPCALFLVAAAVFEANWRRSWLVFGAGLLAGGAAGVGMTVFAGQEWVTFLNPWGKSLSFAFAAGVFLCPALLFLALALATRRAAAHAAKTLHAGKPAGGFEDWKPRRPPVVRVLLAGLIAVTAVGVWMTFDRREHALAKMEYAAQGADYSGVLAAAAKLKPLPPPAEVRLHRALFHSGRLLEELFAHSNQVMWELLPGIGAGTEACRAQAETLLELGQVSEAEHLAHEALELEGDRPDLLRLLADVNILKDRLEAARVFLRVLRRSPAHRAWAEARLDALESDPRLAGDRAISLIRSRLVNTDLPHDGMPTETLLKQLLHANARNSMAHEYLLAHYLLTSDLPRFVSRLGQTNEFHGAALPRHCAEAVLLHQRVHGGRLELHGWTIPAETNRRFQEFCGALDRGATRTPEGRQALAQTFGNTYWLYYLTHPPAEMAAAPPSK